MQQLGRNDCCAVDCFPVPYGSCEPGGVHGLNTLGRVDSAWGKSTLGRYAFGTLQPETKYKLQNLIPANATIFGFMGVSI